MKICYFRLVIFTVWSALFILPGYAVEIRKVDTIDLKLGPNIPYSIYFSLDGRYLIVEETVRPDRIGMPTLNLGAPKLEGGAPENVRKILQMYLFDLNSSNLRPAKLSSVELDANKAFARTFPIRQAPPLKTSSVIETRTLTLGRTEQEIKLRFPSKDSYIAQKAVTMPGNIRFENARGIPIFPGQVLWTYDEHGGGWPGNEGLYAIKNNRRIRMSESDSYNIHQFSYDHLNQRVLLKGSISEDYIYDLKTDSRIELPDAEPSHENYYILIPGRDCILLHKSKLDASGHNYVDMSLQLINFEGKVLHTFAAPPFMPMQIATSKDLLAIPYSVGSESGLVIYKLEEKE